jgi:hypothetical protein
VQRAEPGVGSVTRGDHAPGQANAALADVRAGTGDQLAHLVLRLPAERAAQQQIAVGPAGLGTAQPAAGAAGLLDDLVHPLVAEAEGGAELAQGRAVQVQAAHGPVELGAGHLGVALGVDQPFLSLPGLGEQLVVHSV